MEFSFLLFGETYASKLLQWHESIVGYVDTVHRKYKEAFV